MKKAYLYIVLLFSQLSLSQTIVEWTELNGPLGLGYPVPIPVDTPEPFDGFRTYSGLFAKHQMIESDNNYVKGHIVGQTEYNRDIWAYVFSDENNLTKHGVKEGVMLINGGIHAREWQSPEVLTGIMELLHEKSNDESLHQFLLENTTIITVPVNNVDGFLQTQRYPSQNWYSAQIGPRDGRMRRKNMLSVDESLSSFGDYLFGVDLNRNNDPFWATSNSSSSDASSIVHHGAFVHSEPETLARLNAATLAPADQFRIYTDAHSFSLVHFSVKTNDTNRNSLQTKMLRTFTNHHRSYPAGKVYTDVPNSIGFGIGTTSEYFAYEYQIPSWTLEIEPGNGGGSDYGGLHRDGHDGFILPESQITRVREQLAETFMATWYAQSGPPSITQVRVMDKENQTIIYDAEWDITDPGHRVLYENKVDNLMPGRRYQLLVRFDKPMRINDESGQPQFLQGMESAPNGPHPLNPIISAKIDGESISLLSEDPKTLETKENWVDLKSSEFESYGFYKNDTFIKEFHIDEGATISENSQVQFIVDASDMVKQRIDANPSTVVVWSGGQWISYDDAAGLTTEFTGGADDSYGLSIASVSEHQYPANVQNTGMYYNPLRSGEGFSYELLSYDGSIWLQWFTYDEGKQRWYSDLDKFYGNTISVKEIKAGNGGVFGDDFDSSLINYDSYGDVEIIFSGGKARNPPIGSHYIERTAAMKFTDNSGNKFRTTLHQLSFLLDNASDIYQISPTVVTYGVSAYTGSWYDQNRSGEGYIIEVLENNQVVLLWYTYDLDGNHMWLVDSDGVITETEQGVTLDFNNTNMSRGPNFGNDFDVMDLEVIPWGSLHFELTCDSGTVSYNSTIDGFGQGSYNITKLTHPINIISCN